MGGAQKWNGGGRHPMPPPPRGYGNWPIVLQPIGPQRRSQVSLAGGADRIPGGGINLNTYTYKMSRQAA